MKTLRRLDITDCSLSGSISHIHWENLHNLEVLHLGENALNGSVPSSLFHLPSLETLFLFNNKFDGIIGESLAFSSALAALDLGSNKFEGPIPTIFFNLYSLRRLDLSYNNFSGTIDLTNLFHKLGNITYLDLSFNSLSLIETVGSTSFSDNQISSFSLASCNLEAIPSLLRNQSMLNWLDLSHNNIFGEVPTWVWKPEMYYLNLSHNSLMGFQGPSPNLTSLSSLQILDISSNLLQGPGFQYVSHLGHLRSHFTYGIPIQIGNYIPNIQYLSLSNNSLQGHIPLSLCNISRGIQTVIDLSNNSLSGEIPPCLIAMDFGVLNLKRNILIGSIPNTFSKNCSLQTLDLSENKLQGKVPRSMIECTALEVLNLGGNDLNDGFPCWLMRISSLRVLVLRSNKFYGHVICALSTATKGGWSNLQIIDIAANNFDGRLPHESFKTWTGMMAQPDNVRPKTDQLQFGFYYRDTVTIFSKGLSMELVKILSIFTSIDFSCNNFEGPIPHSVGDLKSLYALNLSHNHFTGKIPSSIGNLKAMESLDLASNHLSGFIPEELASLSFISYLNLSFNQLEGKIPTSTQLQSFSELSYTGNKGLYGPPLKVNCTNTCGTHESPPDPTPTKGGNEIDWELICVEIGYAFGLGTMIGSLVFWRRWRQWCSEHVDRFLFWIFPRLDPYKRNCGIRRVHRRR